MIRKVRPVIVRAAMLLAASTAIVATAAAATNDADPTAGHGDVGSAECVILWIEYWEAVDRGVPATPPDCVP